jgi:hypothetical protein
VSSFAAVAARSCASHEGLALALAEALGCDTAGAPEALRRLAAGLPREAAPDVALAALALQLPLADASRAVAEASHRRLLSRLN